MLPSKSRLSIIALTALLSQAHSQVSFPQCIRDCIDSSPDTTCSTSDIACLCRSSRSTFLVEIVSCMHDNCITIDPSVLLGPLQFACQIAGATIPQSVIDQAESAARLLETAAPTTVTTGGSGGQTIVSSVQVTTTVEGEGKTQTLVYPVTIEKTRTVSGEPTTITQGGSQGSGEATTITQSAGSGSQQTVYVPIVLTTTNSAGSTITTTVSQPGAVNTVTTTDSRGSTVTQPTTLLSTTTIGDASSSNSDSGSSATDGTTTILESTTVAGVPFTSSQTSNAAQTSTTTQGNRPASESNSAPFMDTNNNSASEMKPKNVLGWAGLVFLGAVAMAWL